MRPGPVTPREGELNRYDATETKPTSNCECRFATCPSIAGDCFYRIVTGATESLTTEVSIRAPILGNEEQIYRARYGLKPSLVGGQPVSEAQCRIPTELIEV